MNKVEEINIVVAMKREANPLINYSVKQYRIRGMRINVVINDLQHLATTFFLANITFSVVLF